MAPEESENSGLLEDIFGLLSAGDMEAEEDFIPTTVLEKEDTRVGF